MKFNCPGAEIFRQPHPEIIECPSCGREIEIWTDEVQTLCKNCNQSIMRRGDAGCIDWCKYAKECVGEQIYDKYMKNKVIILKERLIRELEEYFGDDRKRIRHAKEVMDFAEELLKREKADWHIVIPASILHDVGIKEAEKKYNSSAGNYQEKEGPPIARSILLRLGVRKEDIDEICEIVAHHHSPGIVNTQNFKVLYDADSLVNLKDEIGAKGKDKLRREIDKVFLTGTGKEMVRNYFRNVKY